MRHHPISSVASPTDDDVYALADEPEPAGPSPTVLDARAPAPGPRVAVAPPPIPTPTPAAAPASAATPAARPTLADRVGGLLGRLRRPGATAEASAAPGAPPAPGRRGRPTTSWRQDLPAWGLSAVVHLTVFGVLAMATFAPQIQEAVARAIDAAPFDPSIAKAQAEKELAILAPPMDVPRTEAAAPPPVTTYTGPSGGSLGTAPPGTSPTPGLGSRGAGSGDGVGPAGMPGGLASSPQSPVRTMVPSTPGRDFGNGVTISGNVTGHVGSVGEALDQLAAEILRNLADHKLLVVWLFDESGSMRDDQQAIKESFNRVARDLKLNLGDDTRSSDALLHAVVGFGQSVHFELRKPTTDLDAVGQAIDHLMTDESGAEKTMRALQIVLGEYQKYISKDRRLMIILVTDESGDDGAEVEEARQMAVSRNAPIYVVGRQALFGYDQLLLRYIDPVTKDEYWPAIRRGPETPAPEGLQWDGLYERRDEQPSGFAPYELARLVKDTGGIYFILPSEEGLRVRLRERAYSIETLKEYVPDTRSRMDYLKQRNGSPLRRALAEIIDLTKGANLRKHFPVGEPGNLSVLEEAIPEAARTAQERLVLLANIEQRLRALEDARKREPDKRWQAHYDLMLAQVVAYQVKVYEYLACLDEMVELARKGQLVPSKWPIKDQLGVDWVLDHAQPLKAPPKETEKKLVEAKKLLEAVIAQHPKTPWADLAKDVIDRGFGVGRGEWHYSPLYQERANLVPKH
jgi:hypothetical protein